MRVGEDPADMAYERGAGNRAAKVGVEVLKLALPEDTDTEALIKKSISLMQMMMWMASWYSDLFHRI